MTDPRPDAGSRRGADNEAAEATNEMPDDRTVLGARDTGSVTSPRQRQANGENAQKSTGPRTEAGKARISQNATVHGAYARRPDVHLIERGPLAEDREELEALRDAVLEQYAEYGAVVRELALNFARDLIRKGRLSRFEALALTSHAAQEIKRTALHMDVDTSEHGVVERSALHALEQLERCGRIHTSVLKDLERSWRLLQEAVRVERSARNRGPK